jgi:hypothetical protein
VVATITHRYTFSQVLPVMMLCRKCTRALTFANLCSSDRCSAMLKCQMCVFMSVSVLCAGAGAGAGACELLHSLSLSHTHTQRRASSAAGV